MAKNCLTVRLTSRTEIILSRS